MPVRPQAAIVILTYNGRHLVDPCLAALQANTDLRKAQVVVVDNASQDGTADHVAAAHPWVTLLRNRENLGFAGGVDTAIAAVDADAYVLLNSDALVQPGWLDRLLATASMPGVGIVGGLEVDERHRPRWGPDLPPVGERMQEDRERVSFACALVRREVVDRIGHLDHAYFMYHEDWDYCHRARAAGFRVLYDPNVVVVHPGEGSFKGQPSAWKTRVRTASRLRYEHTHFSRAERLRRLLREPLLAGYWAKQGLLRPYLQGVRQAWAMRHDIRRRRADPTGFVAAPGPSPPRHVALALPWAPWKGTGGAERHVHELACALLAQGLRVTVITAAPAPPEPTDLPYAAVVVDSARLRAARAARQRLPAGRTLARQAEEREFGRLAARVAQRCGADLLHRHFVHETRFRPGLPLVYTLHNGDLPRDAAGTGRLVARDVRRREQGLRDGIVSADAVVCVSEHVEDSVVRRLGVDRAVHVVWNACPYPAPGLSKADARRRLGLNEADRVVLFIGHLWRHKRVLRLLPLLDEPDVQLVLVGKGELEGDLRPAAATEPRLRLLGVVDEDTKRLWLRAADVLALPSGTFEGNPIVMMEALRSGTPVYGTMATWLPPELRPFGRFGEDVRLALDAMAIDATPAIGLVPQWDEVARQTHRVYGEALEAFGRLKR